METKTVQLKCIDETNPRDVLAALGAFKVASLLDGNAKMRWVGAVPVIESGATVEDIATKFYKTIRELCALPLSPGASLGMPVLKSRGDVTAAWKREWSEIIGLLPPGSLAYDRNVRIRVDNFREVVRREIARDPQSLATEMLAALGSDACIEREGSHAGKIRTSSFNLANGGSNKCLLCDLVICVSLLNEKKIIDDLRGPIRAEDEYGSLGLDPSDMHDRATESLGDEDGEGGFGTKSITNATLNALAFIGLSFFPVMPDNFGRARTGGFDKLGTKWVWPIWTPRLSLRMVGTLLLSPMLQADPPDKAALARCGVESLYESRLEDPNDQGRAFFRPSKLL